MTDRQPARIGVECYAGHRGEQTPHTLILGDRRIAVAELLDAWLAPDCRYTKLRGADGDTYLVRHDERSDAWELTMFRTEPLTDGERDASAGLCCGNRSIGGRKTPVKAAFAQFSSIIHAAPTPRPSRRPDDAVP